MCIFAPVPLPFILQLLEGNYTSSHDAQGGLQYSHTADCVLEMTLLWGHDPREQSHSDLVNVCVAPGIKLMTLQSRHT